MHMHCHADVQILPSNKVLEAKHSAISSLFNQKLNKYFLTKIQEINAIYGEQQLENISSTINLIKEFCNYFKLLDK